QEPQNELLVIKLTIQNIDATTILVDTRSSVDIIFKSTLERMKTAMMEISKEPTNLTAKEGSVTKTLEFQVINRPESYNAIIGTPWLNLIQAVPMSQVFNSSRNQDDLG